MKKDNAWYSSKETDYETPNMFFKSINDIFKFTLDAAASKGNTKVKNFYSKKDNALIKEWNGIVFCNPPYNRQSPIDPWIHKSEHEIKKNPKSKIICFLIPVRTETKIWQQHIFKNCTYICFLKRRVHFIHPGKIKGARSSSNFPPGLIIYTKNKLSNKQLEMLNQLGTTIQMSGQRLTT